MLELSEQVVMLVSWEASDASSPSKLITSGSCQSLIFFLIWQHYNLPNNTNTLSNENNNTVTNFLQLLYLIIAEFEGFIFQFPLLLCFFFIQFDNIHEHLGL